MPKIKYFTIILIVILIINSCKKVTPKNDSEPIQNLSVEIPFDNLGLIESTFIPFPDKSFAICATEIGINNLHFFHFDKELKLLESSLFSNTNYNNQTIVIGERVFSLMGSDLIETNYNFKILNQNTHIDKDLGLNSKTINTVICKGPNGSILLATNNSTNGKFVLAEYDLDIAKPLWVVDTLSNTSGPQNLSSLAFLNGKIYLMGYSGWGSSTVGIMKQYEWGGELNWKNSDKYLSGYFKILDSTIFFLSGIRKVLENGIIENKCQGSLIYENTFKKYTIFKSEGYFGRFRNTYQTFQIGHLANLTSEFKTEKEKSIKVDYCINNTFGPVDKDSWVYLSVFLDANDGGKRKLRLEKINKNLD